MGYFLDIDIILLFIFCFYSCFCIVIVLYFYFYIFFRVSLFLRFLSCDIVFLGSIIKKSLFLFFFCGIYWFICFFYVF